MDGKLIVVFDNTKTLYSNVLRILSLSLSLLPHSPQYQVLFVVIIARIVKISLGVTRYNTVIVHSVNFIIQRKRAASLSAALSTESSEYKYVFKKHFIP